MDHKSVRGIKTVRGLRSKMANLDKENEETASKIPVRKSVPTTPTTVRKTQFCSTPICTSRRPNFQVSPIERKFRLPSLQETDDELETKTTEEEKVPSSQPNTIPSNVKQKIFEIVTLSDDDTIFFTKKQQNSEKVAIPTKDKSEKKSSPVPTIKDKPMTKKHKTLVKSEVMEENEEENDVSYNNAVNRYILKPVKRIEEDKENKKLENHMNPVSNASTANIKKGKQSTKIYDLVSDDTDMEQIPPQKPKRKQLQKTAKKDMISTRKNNNSKEKKSTEIKLSFLAENEDKEEKISSLKISVSPESEAKPMRETNHSETVNAIKSLRARPPSRLYVPTSRYWLVKKPEMKNSQMVVQKDEDNQKTETDKLIKKAQKSVLSSSNDELQGDTDKNKLTNSDEIVPEVRTSIEKTIKENNFTEGMLDDKKNKPQLKKTPKSLMSRRKQRKGTENNNKTKSSIKKLQRKNLGESKMSCNKLDKSAKVVLYDVFSKYKVEKQNIAAKNKSKVYKNLKSFRGNNSQKTFIEPNVSCEEANNIEEDKRNRTEITNLHEEIVPMGNGQCSSKNNLEELKRRNSNSEIADNPEKKQKLEIQPSLKLSRPLVLPFDWKLSVVVPENDLFGNFPNRLGVDKSGNEVHKNYSIQHPDFSSGFLKIMPNGTKNSDKLQKTNKSFLILEGNAEVAINQVKRQLRGGESFFVPINNSYSIRNTSETSSLLIYFTRFHSSTNRT